MAPINYFFLLLFVLFIACVSSKKIEAEFPTQMMPHVKEHYQTEYNKGYTLYNLNCAKCHNKKERGKVIVPDYTLEQLKGYELRITNKKHTQALTDSTVTEEELGQIMVFLTYKKKNSIKNKN